MRPQTAAHVLATLALNGKRLIPKAPTARSEVLGETQLFEPRGIEWTVTDDLDGQAGHSGTCGHDI